MKNVTNILNQKKYAAVLLTFGFAPELEFGSCRGCWLYENGYYNSKLCIKIGKFSENKDCLSEGVIVKLIRKEDERDYENR